MNHLPIAIFDSGVGGLTLLHRALQELPNENFIYYADTEHVPYGIKPKEEVRQYVLRAAAFLNNVGIKALLVACNTATSIAVQDLRTTYSFPVLGMEPAVKPAVERTAGKRVLVLATPLTLQEQKFRDLVSRVDNEKVVDFLALSELVDFAEQFVFDEVTILPLLKNKFSEIDTTTYGTIVLGCTHFPFFKNTIAKLFPPNINIVDGNEGTVRHLKNVLLSKHLLNQMKEKGGVVYYDSGKQATVERFAKYLALFK